MKRPLLFFLFFLTSQALFSQVANLENIKYKPNPRSSSEVKLYSYSLGFRAFSLEQFPKLLKQQNAADFKDLYLNSVFLKVNDNQINYRFFASYNNNNDLTFANECAGCEIAKGKLNDFAFKIGFEKLISYSAVRPYFGFDLGFRKTRFKGDVQNASVVPRTTPYDVTNEKNGGFVSPLIGVNFNIINHFTLGVESNLDVLYSYERQEKTLQDAARTTTFDNNRNWEFLLRPVGVYLQYNFGPND